jgi:hypothetical protein
VLVLVAGGFLIFFSSCLGAFSGFPNRNSSYPSWLIGGGLLVGATMFFAGLVLGLVWLVLTIARAVSTPSDAPRLGVGLPTGLPVRSSSAAEEEHLVLWRLRIAVIVLLVFAWGGPMLTLTRLSYMMRPYLGFFVVSWLLGEAPYIVALIRLVRGPDRAGIAVSLATGCLQIAFLAFEVFTRFGGLAGLALFSVTPIAEILIVAFAWQLGRMQPPEGDDNAILAASFGCVGAYLLLVHFVLTYLRPTLFR